ncbi:MAG: hypothetical protein ACRYGL_12470 [Janthinobacterium lividum]
MPREQQVGHRFPAIYTSFRHIAPEAAVASSTRRPSMCCKIGEGWMWKGKLTSVMPSPNTATLTPLDEQIEPGKT